MAVAGIAAGTILDAESITDEDLVDRYRQGSEDALSLLLARYRNFTRMKARSYFLVGADREDIVQEGMIGLYKAIRDFNARKEAAFRAFAEICITRQILTAIKTATRQKHGPLNTYVSLSQPVAAEEDADRDLMDVLDNRQARDPADVVISSEEYRSIKIAFGEILSDFEAEVLHLYVEGKSYQEIGVLLHRHMKSVDNALQRIKRKVELHLKDRGNRLPPALVSAAQGRRDEKEASRAGRAAAPQEVVTEPPAPRLGSKGARSKRARGNGSRTPRSSGTRKRRR